MGRQTQPNETRDRLYSAPAIPLFSSAEFSCFLARSSLKFNSDGELSVSFLIPAGSVDDALPLRYLAANPLPLTVTVEVDSSYLADLEDSESRIHAM
jgi:hypothetical protein